MLSRTANHYWGVVIDAPDARELAQFYVRLLGWEVGTDKPEWVTMKPPGEGVAYLAVQTNDGYVRPVWPGTDGQQQMMLHLDIEVGDLADAVQRALEAGATLPEHQPQEKVRVLLDPAGHPFCLYVDA